jgi:hypothetical protein
MFEMRRSEWLLLGGTALVIVAVNKLVVHDDDNTWPSLLLVSFWAGRGLVELRRWRTRRSEHRSLRRPHRGSGTSG